MNLAFKCPDCRHADLPPVHDGQEARRSTIGDAACCGGIFSQDRQTTSTSTEDARVAASEGSIAVGKGGRYVESGGIDLSGSSSAELGPKLNAGGDITVTSSDPDVLKTALEAYSEQSLSNTSAFSSFAKQAHEQQADDLATLLGALGQLKETTDEEAQQRKGVFYIALALLAVIGLIFVPWRKWL